MGLFDRFKKRVKQPSTEEEITVDENSPEAAFAFAERQKNLLKINDNILRSETAAISMISIISFNLLS